MPRPGSPPFTLRLAYFSVVKGCQVSGKKPGVPRAAGFRGTPGVGVGRRVAGVLSGLAAQKWIHVQREELSALDDLGIAERIVSLIVQQVPTRADQIEGGNHARGL